MEILDAVEARVLGALIEKEATTPEYYPLSLNALQNACNQKSNREPVTNYDQDTIYDAVNRLREKKLALTITGSGRVDKYAQRISETLNLGRRELAALGTVLLRGPQTASEIKDRAERMFSFADARETEAVLEKMGELPGGALIKKLSRQTGQKEPRYAHLLSGEPSLESSAAEPITPAPSRVAQIEQDLKQLRAEFDELQKRFKELEAQLR